MENWHKTNNRLPNPLRSLIVRQAPSLCPWIKIRLRRSIALCGVMSNLYRSLTKNLQTTMIDYSVKGNHQMILFFYWLLYCIQESLKVKITHVWCCVMIFDILFLFVSHHLGKAETCLRGQRGNFSTSFTLIIS